jgi:hypothetical protein
MKIAFETTVRDNKKYIPSLEFPQLVVLAECIDIVNNIRNADGGEDNFDNIYASRAMDVALEEMAIGAYELEKTLERIGQTELDTTQDELRARMVKYYARLQGLQLKVEKRMAELKANADRKANREDTIAILAPVLKELHEIKTAVNKNAAANKKGFDSLKPVSHQSLAELVKTLPPLKQEREDENWVTRTTAVKLTQEEVDTLKKQRQNGENILFKGFEYGRDTKGRIWRKSEGRKYFYLRKTLLGQNISR